MQEQIKTQDPATMEAFRLHTIDEKFSLLDDLFTEVRCSLDVFAGQFDGDKKDSGHLNDEILFFALQGILRQLKAAEETACSLRRITLPQQHP
jgi:hypothetical protein